MNRSTIFSQQQGRSFDILNGWKDALIGFGNMWQASAGTTASTVTGFVASASAPPSLTINLTAGQIQQLYDIDATAWGALASDTTQIMQQGYAIAQSLLLSTSGLTSGQSYYALVQCSFEQLDVVRTNDPTGGLLPYYNSANPAQPLQGPNNSGAIQDTERESVANVSVIYGAPSSGTPVVPTASGGNVPMYAVLLTYGQTTVTTILPTSPNVQADYPYAPFYPGLIGVSPLTPSGSHHGGIAGQAAKINAATEIDGTLGLGQLPVTNTDPPVAGGDIVLGGTIPILVIGTVAPSGNVAGQVGDEYFNEDTNFLYICTTEGDAADAVWNQISPGGISQYVSSSPLSSFAGGTYYLIDSSAGAFTVNLVAAANMAGQLLGFKNIGANIVTINPISVEAIEFQSTNTPYYLPNKGNSVTLAPRASVGYYIINAI